MSVDEQLLYESRVRMRQAVLAAAAGLLLVAATILAFTGPQVKVSELTLNLVTAKRRFPIDLISAILTGTALIGFALTVTFLYDVTRARNEKLGPIMRVLVILGAIGFAIGDIGESAASAVLANKFVGSGSQTYVQAHQLTKTPLLVVFPLVLQLGALLFAIGVVMISLNAMRVGLLTKGLGYIGVAVGVATILLIGSPPAVLVQGFWLLALAYLFSGRWPGGVPLAWRSGKAEPWPTAQELREQRMRARDGRTVEGRVRPAAKEPAGARSRGSDNPQKPAAGDPQRTRATTPKRKRKRRR